MVDPNEVVLQDIINMMEEDDADKHILEKDNFNTENEHDMAQVILKRLCYNFYLWMYRGIILCGLLGLFASIIVIPTLIFLLQYGYKNSSIIKLESKYWKNMGLRRREIKEKVNEKWKNIILKKEKQTKKLKEQARGELQEMYGIKADKNLEESEESEFDTTLEDSSEVETSSEELDVAKGPENVARHPPVYDYSRFPGGEIYQVLELSQPILVYKDRRNSYS